MACTGTYTTSLLSLLDLTLTNLCTTSCSSATTYTI